VNPRSLLDVGCASGTMLSALHNEFPATSLVGLDIAADLIELAKAKVGEFSHLVCDDAVSWLPDTSIDVIVASGVLSIWEDFRVPLQRWLSWLADKGLLLIFGRFNSRDVDTIIRFRLEGDDFWQGGLTSYSTTSVSKYLDSLGKKHSWIPFTLARDLMPSADPIATWTETTSDGRKLVINGANVIAQHYFLMISNQ